MAAAGSTDTVRADERADPFEQFRATRYFTSLDGLRALAILPVIWHHSSLTPLAGVWGKGPAGVQLFFVLSGFLITTLLLRERQTRGAVSLSRFYARRCLRIFPLYYLVLAGISLQAWLSLPNPSNQHFFEHWIYFATFTSNWWVDWGAPHPILFAFAWTLAVEEQFYALWAPVMRWTRGLLAPFGIMLLLLLLSQAVTWSALEQSLPGGFGATFCAGLSSSICLGSLLAVALHHERTFRWSYKALGRRSSGAVVLLLVGVCLAFDVHHLIFHLSLCAWVGVSVARPDHLQRRLLNHRYLQFIGRCSYGLYLTHFIAIGGVRLFIAPSHNILVFVTALPLALLIAQLSLHLVERPLLRYRVRFASNVA